MAGPIRYVTVRVVLGGPAAPSALDEASLPPLQSLDLGDGASASRPLLLSETPVAILNVVADVTTIVASVAALGGWLYKLTHRKGVVIERIGRTTIERVTEDEIVRVLREEIEREVEEHGST
jgi:hypothetical protein